MVNLINQGFPSKHLPSEVDIRDFWEVRHRLCTERDLVLMNGRIIVPKFLRGKVLRCLHSTHKAWMAWMLTLMILYIVLVWTHPYGNHCPKSATRTHYRNSILGMAFQTNSKGHILRWKCCIPRLCKQTNWLAHFVPPKIRWRHYTQVNANLLTTVSYICHPRRTQYGWRPAFHLQHIPAVPVWSTDCLWSHIPNLMAGQNSPWKTANRIVNGNTGTKNFLDNDNVAWAILQYRNTPIQGIGLSLAQLLLHRWLRDSIPSQSRLYKPHYRNAKIVERYNRYTHNLCQFRAGDTIVIQNPLNHRWNTVGKS